MNTFRLLKQSTIKQMWTAQKTTGGKTIPYGLGWRVGDYQGRQRVGHSGGQAGTSTHLLILPADGVVVGLMSNLQGLRLTQLATQIVGDLLPPSRWADAISQETLTDEVKRIHTRLPKYLARQDVFKRQYRNARRDLTILAMLFAISAESQQEFRWKADAALARDRFARTARIAKVSSVQVFNDCQLRAQDLKTLVLGGRLKDEKKAARSSRVNDWSQVVDRLPLMKRMERAAKEISTKVAEKKLDGLRHEAEMLATIAKVVGSKSMEDSDDEAHRGHTQQLYEAAMQLKQAAGEKNLPRSTAAVGRLTATCAKCHESFR